MYVADVTLTSASAEKDFDVVVYGDAGRPVVVFPEGDASCTSWENNGMIERLLGLVEKGRVQLFATDSADDEGWYFRTADQGYRVGSVGSYFSYVEGELHDYVSAFSSSEELPLLVGVGMGAMNATVEMLRRPDLYGGLLAVSGTYDVRAFVDGELDEGWLAFSPVDIVASLGDDAILDLTGKPLAFVCGTHGSETGADTQRALEGALRACRIPATFEYWGADVSHDWRWWREEVAQLLPCLLEPGGLEERALAARLARARGAAERTADTVEQLRSALADARRALAGARDAEGAARERLAREEESVRARRTEEERLGAVAQEAWARRDEAADALARAIERGNAAQAEADSASQERAKAEWIAGEARAALADARGRTKELEGRVREAEEACEGASADAEQAAEALAEVQGTAGAASEAGAARPAGGAPRGAKRAPQGADDRPEA
jgi:esterase/lipase superfamily enzyme